MLGDGLGHWQQQVAPRIIGKSHEQGLDNHPSKQLGATTKPRLGSHLLSDEHPQSSRSEGIMKLAERACEIGQDVDQYKVSPIENRGSGPCSPQAVVVWCSRFLMTSLAGL